MPKNDPLAEACMIGVLRNQNREYWTASGLWQQRYRVAMFYLKLMGALAVAGWCWAIWQAAHS
jgi:hypothetical protein